MLIAVSPYHLSTREPAAMASLLLASRVLTILPGPENGDAAAATRVAARVRAYADLARSWEWARELFDAEVISSGHDGLSPMEDLHRVWEWIRDDDRYAPLRVFMHRGPNGDEESYLQAIAADILKAGPDPGLSVPLAAGLDRFAARVGAFVARSAGASIAQNMESGLGTVIATIAVPILVQADAERLLHARDVLHQPLSELRQVLDELLGEVITRGRNAVRRLADAAHAYAAAFTESRKAVFEDSASDSVRAVESIVMVSIVSLPVDAVLRSGVAALRVFTGEPRIPQGMLARAGARDETEGRRVLAMIVRAAGTRRG